MTGIRWQVASTTCHLQLLTCYPKTNLNNDELVDRLGQHIKSLRKDRNLTLVQLAHKSGVSRSLLSQIERGQANPTLGTLWNLSRALGLDMAEIVEEIETNDPAETSIEYLTADSTPHIRQAQSGVTLSILNPPTLVEQFEWYKLEIEPGGTLISDPHIQGCREHLTILRGQAKLISGEQTQLLNQGDTARYRADLPHQIRCLGNDKLEAILIVMN